MNNENYFDDFIKSYGIIGKNFSNELVDLLKQKLSITKDLNYKVNKSEETPEERDFRILREKAVEREAKIDKILKK